MNRYNLYRDSGVEWIGKIPSEWDVSRVQWGLEEINIQNNPVQTKDILSLTIKDGVIPYDEKGNIGNKSKEDLAQYKLAFPDTLVINSMNVIIGAVGICQYKGCVSPVYYVFKARENSDLRYLYYIFKLPTFQKELRKYANGILEIRLRISVHDVLRRIIPFPQKEIQTCISDYLDKKISHIDSIISEAKASIEEYKAWKASLIYEAVTKGLDPDAEMKDSGVEWIGKIPSCWERMRIKNCATFMPKVDFSTIKKDDVVTFTPMDCIKNGYFENKGSVYSEIEGSYTPYAEGDIVFAKVTPCFENGNAAIMENLYSKVGLGSSELFVLRAQNIDPKYLFYFIRNKGFVQAATSTMTGTGGLKRVSSDFIRNCPIPVPSMDEQKKVADYLDRRCKCIDDLISEKESLISDLESYKKSLIFEVVTGKRRVC